MSEIEMQNESGVEVNVGEKVKVVKPKLPAKYVRFYDVFTKIIGDLTVGKEGKEAVLSSELATNILFEVGAFEEVATQMAMMDALHSKASQKEGRNGLKQYKNAYLVEKGLKNVPASKKRASKKTKKTDVVESGAESGTETEVTKPKAKRGRPSSKAVSVPVTEVSEVVPAVSEVVPAEVAVDAVAVTETAVKEKKKRATSSKKTQKPQVVSPDE